MEEAYDAPVPTIVWTLRPVGTTTLVRDTRRSVEPTVLEK